MLLSATALTFVKSFPPLVSSTNAAPVSNCHKALQSVHSEKSFPAAAEGDGDIDGLKLGDNDGLTLGLIETEGDTDGLIDGEIEGDTDGLILGDIDGLVDPAANSIANPSSSAADSSAVVVTSWLPSGSQTISYPSPYCWTVISSRPLC